MTAVIGTTISPQSYEIVRDRIGRILAEEITNQYALTKDKDLKVNNWIERFIPFDNKELPSVNVSLAEGMYGQPGMWNTAIQADGLYRYYIDCYVNAVSKDGEGGDSKAIVKLHRLMGVCRSIIMDARYVRLGFKAPPGFVASRHIESIQIKDPNPKENDMQSTVMGRIVLSVKLPETPEYAQFSPTRTTKTTVKLSDTDKGYLWINLNIDDPYFYDYSFDKYFE
jgi:hypothetical protein